MNKVGLLPKLAVTGIKKNGVAYIPYMLVTSFSVFVFFIFSAICDNEMMYTLPHAMYLLMLMQIGRVLLGIILAPVLFSTNKFLIKQRKNELGLYNVLGLDRKYISMIMMIETLVMYGVTVALGILVATVFSKLIYLFLMNLSGLAVQAEFVASKGSYMITIAYFGVLFMFNLVVNLWQVSRSKPIDLMKSSKKGERQMHFLGIKTFIGMMVLGTGYYIALTAQIDGYIFMVFFLAVFLVIVGTRMLFKSGTIATLNWMKNRPSIYYKKNNFVTISGMLYRMKRNAQGLSDICIFSTMIMITLICTFSLMFGQDDAIAFNYPMDATYSFNRTSFSGLSAFEAEMKNLEKKHQIEVAGKKVYSLQKLHVIKNESACSENLSKDWRMQDAEVLLLMNLQDYNAMENKEETLAEDEVLIFGSSIDYGYDTLTLNDKTYQVKEELQSLKIERKENKNIMTNTYYVILPDATQVAYWAEAMRMTDESDLLEMVSFNMVGDKENKDAFIKELNIYCQNVENFHSSDYIGEWENDTRPMNGGLLFLGIFCGIVFSVCLVLMMYYKQISEGFEDQKNFEILKQVGMSDQEVRSTIRRQILIVFFLPLLAAMLHTFIGLHIVKGLLGTIFLFNGELILVCSFSVMIFFGVLYVLSYGMTSRAYYRIVK